MKKKEGKVVQQECTSSTSHEKPTIFVFVKLYINVYIRFYFAIEVFFLFVWPWRSDRRNKYGLRKIGKKVDHCEAPLFLRTRKKKTREKKPHTLPQQRRWIFGYSSPRMGSGQLYPVTRIFRGLKKKNAMREIYCTFSVPSICGHHFALTWQCGTLSCGHIHVSSLPFITHIHIENPLPQVTGLLLLHHPVTLFRPLARA